MKISGATRAALAFAAVCGGAYFGYNFITDQMVMNEKFTQISPGNVNIVGVDPGAGYRIIVANDIAQLVQASGDFEGKETEGGGATEGAIKNRLPIREMLESLQGNERALSAFVTRLNDLQENENWPSERVVWTEDELRKALGGDREAEKRLVSDLNVRLDGTPLPGLRFSALENGIIIETRVPIQVSVAGTLKTLYATVQEPYRPRFLRAVEDSYEGKNISREDQLGFYAQEAKVLLEDPKQRENVREVLLSKISPELAKERAVNPERVLKLAEVVVNESFVQGASYDRVDMMDGKPRFNLRLRLSDEGRKRLWQFSKRRMGSHILLTVDGIPITAARIQHQLSDSQVVLTQMPDEVLVREAVDAINESRGTSKS